MCLVMGRGGLAPEQQTHGAVYSAKVCAANPCSYGLFCLPLPAWLQHKPTFEPWRGGRVSRPLLKAAAESPF